MSTRRDQPHAAASGERVRPLRARTILHQRGRFGPNMTPMVDVVLVILIFFMAASTIAGQEWFLRADLPKPEDDQNSEIGFDLPAPVLDAQLYVTDGSIMVRGIGDSPRSLDEFVGQIRTMDDASQSGLILRISSADAVPYGSVMALHDAAHEKGMRVAIR